ncbi:hypothetical protein ACU8KH_04500 [Lachancea thermotolerans]
MSLGKSDALKQQLRELSFLLAKNRLQERQDTSSINSIKSFLSTEVSSTESSRANDAVILSEGVDCGKRPLSQTLELSVDFQQRKHHKPSYRELELEIHDFPVIETVAGDLYESEGQLHTQAVNSLSYLDSEVEWSENARPARSEGMETGQVLAEHISEVVDRQDNSYINTSTSISNLEDSNITKSEQTVTKSNDASSTLLQAKPLEIKTLKSIIKPLLDKAEFEMSHDSWDSLRSFSGSLTDVVGKMFKDSSASKTKRLNRRFFISLFQECRVLSQNSDINDIFCVCSESLCAEELSELEIALFK